MTNWDAKALPGALPISVTHVSIVYGDGKVPITGFYLAHINCGTRLYKIGFSLAYCIFSGCGTPD